MKNFRIAKYGYALLLIGLIALRHGPQIHRIILHEFQESAYLLLTYMEVYCS